jgi:ABC-type transport system involved in multi-copper enzyme maturation permease subunit
MLACYIVCGGIIIMYYVVCIILSLVFAHGVDTNTFASLGLALLFMLGAGGFAFFVSAISKKGTVAIIITIAALLMIFNMVDQILAIYDIEPVFSLTYAGTDISNVLAGNTTLHNQPVGASGITMSYFYPSHALAVSIMTIWFAVTTVLSAIIFKKREF